MGSSCFSRGNGKNLPLIQQYLKSNGLATQITLKGCRCGNVCAGGPNIWIDDALVPGMTGDRLGNFLDSLILPTQTPVPTGINAICQPPSTP